LIECGCCLCQDDIEADVDETDDTTNSSRGLSLFDTQSSGISSASASASTWFDTQSSASAIAGALSDTQSSASLGASTWSLRAGSTAASGTVDVGESFSSVARPWNVLIDPCPPVSVDFGDISTPSDCASEMSWVSSCSSSSSGVALTNGSMHPITSHWAECGTDNTADERTILSARAARSNASHTITSASAALCDTDSTIVSASSSKLTNSLSSCDDKDVSSAIVGDSDDTDVDAVWECWSPRRSPSKQRTSPDKLCAVVTKKRKKHVSPVIYDSDEDDDGGGGGGGKSSNKRRHCTTSSNTAAKEKSVKTVSEALKSNKCWLSEKATVEWTGDLCVSLT